MGADQTAAKCTIEMNHEIRHLSQTFFLKLKHIMCNHTFYTLDDDAIMNFPPLRSLLRAAHWNGFQLHYLSSSPKCILG